MQHTTALNETQMSVLRLVATSHVAPPAVVKVCMKEDLNKFVGEGAGRVMYSYFEDGSVVQRLPLELTAAGHGG